ncbi:hypothetical protein TKK_0011589 [Trichogramma kaykai]
MSSHANSTTFINREMLDKSLLNLTLSFYENPLMSRKIVDDMINKMSRFVDDSLIPFIQHEMSIKLQPNTDICTYKKVQFLLGDCKNLFSKYNTEYSRLQIYDTKSHYVPPKLFKIGKNNQFVACDDDCNVKNVQEKIIHAAHVPLKETLEKYFSKPDILNEILEYMDELSHDDSRLSNIIQGKMWLEKYKDPEKIILPLYLYFDEFECRGPLASHAGEEKLGGVYTSLACLPPHMAGKNENVFLSTVVHAKYHDAFGNSAIFAKVGKWLQVTGYELRPNPDNDMKIEAYLNRSSEIIEISNAI